MISLRDKSHVLHTRKGGNHVSIHSANNTGLQIWKFPTKTVCVIVPIAKLRMLSKVCFFQEYILEFNFSK